jgi:hypothetical protein
VVGGTLIANDNWRLGRIGGGSFDTRSGTKAVMFDFRYAVHN